MTEVAMKVESSGGDGTAERAAAPGEAPSAAALGVGFAAIYLIWGSTYLAIRFAVESIPPFLMLAARFLAAGVLMYAWLRLRGTPRPSPRQWAGAAAVGGLLLLGGTGAVGWAEQWIPSGLAALIVAIVPVWMVLMDWAGPNRRRPGRAVVIGLVLGLAGVAVLVGPVDLGGGGRMQFIGSMVVVLGTLSWATGSVYGQRLPRPASTWMTAALQMTMGGVLLAGAGTAMGEWGRLDLSAISQRSALSLGYLMVFGSLIAFAAYVYLLRHSTPARVGSYAYVNPVVAVLLGWAMAAEPVTARTVIAAATILTGVVLIVTHRSPEPSVLSAEAERAGAGEGPTSATQPVACKAS